MKEYALIEGGFVIDIINSKIKPVAPEHLTVVELQEGHNSIVGNKYDEDDNAWSNSDDTKAITIEEQILFETHYQTALLGILSLGGI